VEEEQGGTEGGRGQGDDLVRLDRHMFARTHSRICADVPMSARMLGRVCADASATARTQGRVRADASLFTPGNFITDATVRLSHG
jgi:hypothetical protein